MLYEEICYHCKAVDGLHAHEETCLENTAEEPAEEGVERNAHVHELFRTILDIVSTQLSVRFGEVD